MAECIERKAALDAVHKQCDPCGAAVEAVLSVPVADAAPVVHGRWVLHYAAIGAPYTECSRCCADIAVPMVGGEFLKLDMREMPYCPNCGAKMDGGASE